ncbi:MAG: hypothetical protein US52_C0051G0018 [candidate division WS6 bacterium GW2011_GWA2_37_6]|uniref:Glycerophosphoryl diester phosphodiesterase membrane domain-containing protein n=1 Tax=candidate division WS6 bacterium GW2011_GWA2_37_6 TaxID=1619087 RepID=A0A0G0K208_9BACT|nr:MAG: hypothetical protein US52_C0051G0018 [candidate division WS6 bacterium GW2011_GWA2_37_6]
MDYFKKVEESIKFAWKYKTLWLFGFLISLFGSEGVSNQYNTNSNSGNEKLDGAYDKVADLFEEPAFIAFVIVAICLGLIVALVGWYITSVSKAALINAVKMEQKGEEPTFKKGWKYGKTKALDFIKLDLIALLLGLVIVLFLIPIIIICIVFPPLLCLLCLGIPVFIIGAILWWMTLNAAQRYIVLKDMSAMESLKAGWKLTKTKIVTYFTAGLVSLIPGCLWGIIIFPLGLLAAVAVIFILIGVVSSSPVIGLIILASVIFSFSLLVAVVNSPYTVFVYTYWTKVLMELMDGKADTKVSNKDEK